MTGFCDLALALGLTLNGTCHAPTPAVEPLPANEPAVWSFKAPPPPPPPPPAPAAVTAAPEFPPVVIVRREPPPPPPPPAPTVVVNPYEQAVAVVYQRRAAAKWEPVAVESASASAPGPTPLDLQTVAMATRKYQEKSATSTGPVDNSRVVTTDRYISGILETGINTQLDGSTDGGPVVIQTTRDVYGYHGRNVLIPKGSRLVCQYKSLAKVGSSRAPLKCSRVLLGGSRAEILSKSDIGDMQGELGVSGDVDNRFLERYGTAFILAGISTAVQMAVNMSGSGGTSTAVATAGGATSNYSSSGAGGALSSGSQQLSQQLGQITAATLQQTLNLTPILKVPQGTRIQIRPEADWYIAKAE